MLSGKHWNYVKVTSGGSVYDCKSGKQTKSFAFFYEVSGEKKRKVVSGNSIEELTAKAVAFLDKIDKEYADAKEKESAVLNEIAKPARLTFRDVGLMWFETYQAKMQDDDNPISYTSVESRDLSLRKIFDNIGEMYIDEINQQTAKKLISNCSIKPNGTYYSRSYIDKLQQVFLLVMRYANKHGLSNHIIEPVTLSQNLTTVKTDERFLDKEQIAEILNIVSGNARYKTLLKLLIATGLRQEEAFALHIKDFNVKKNGKVELTINKTVVEVEPYTYRIVPRTKTERSTRVVIISYGTYKMVMDYYNSCINLETEYETYLRQLNKMEGYIFIDKDKKPINKRTFQRSFRNYINRNGGKELGYNVSLHMFRHSYASLMAEKLPADKVAKMMGDTIKTVEDNYYSLSEGAKDEICDVSTSVLESIDSLRF